MTNSEIILQIIINLVQNAPAPTGNYWYLSFPKTFQEAVDENFRRISEIKKRVISIDQSYFR